MGYGMPPPCHESNELRQLKETEEERASGDAGDREEGVASGAAGLRDSDCVIIILSFWGSALLHIKSVEQGRGPWEPTPQGCDNCGKARPPLWSHLFLSALQEVCTSFEEPAPPGFSPTTQRHPQSPVLSS